MIDNWLLRFINQKDSSVQIIVILNINIRLYHLADVILKATDNLRLTRKTDERKWKESGKKGETRKLDKEVKGESEIKIWKDDEFSRS